MKENCGVIAVADLAQKKDVVPLTVGIARGLWHRGGLGAGVSWMRTEQGKKIMDVFKSGGTMDEVLNMDRISALGAESTIAIAHTRYATNGSLRECMMQPYSYGEDASSFPFSIAFNGNIANVPAMTARLTDLGHPPRMEGDTEIIGRTIIESVSRHGRDNMGRVFEDLNVLDGSFNIVMLSDDGIHAVRDRNGFHPMVWAQKDSLVAVASEDRAIREFWPRAQPQDVKPGHMLHVPMNGKKILHEPLWRADPALCFFEAVYFADYRSTFDGVSTSNARRECGKILAEMDKDRPSSDKVVPVPDSGKTAAASYAKARKLRQVDLILANEGVGRTFTAAANREEKARLKYNLDTTMLRGQSIILIDDSLVRGTTMRELAKRLREESGVAEVHLRLASPAIISPCFYGIDMSTVKELLVRKYSDGKATKDGVLPDEVLRALAKDLGVDSIKYMPIHTIPRALGRKERKLCMACVTGKYPTAEGSRLSLLAEQNAGCGTCGGCGS